MSWEGVEKRDTKKEENLEIIHVVGYIKKNTVCWYK